MKKSLKNPRGITLVALVITVIILLILAGISISALTNQGLFAKAQQAKQKSENAQKEESEILENYLAQMNAISFKNVDKTKTNPEAAMPKGAIVIEGDANKGIVIKDSKDNEWVWVEVPMSVTAEKTTDSDIETALKGYAGDYREGAEGQRCSWTDTYYSGCGMTETEYNTAKSKMLKSIQTNGGFWISRYEIGDSTATNNNYAVRTSDSGIRGVAVSKPNQIPYNYVTCSQAQQLSSGMSTDTTKTSSLLFGIQWDLTCKFLQEKGKLSIAQIKGGDGIGSTNWGNYKNATVTSIKTGANQLISENWTASTTDKPDNRSILLTTGASENTNKMNIYDFAGNEWEWTLEKTSDTSCPCANRGGSYNNIGSGNPASSRDNNSFTTDSYSSVGFRSALY